MIAVKALLIVQVGGTITVAQMSKAQPALPRDIDHRLGLRIVELAEFHYQRVLADEKPARTRRPILMTVKPQHRTKVIRPIRR